MLKVPLVTCGKSQKEFTMYKYLTRKQGVSSENEQKLWRYIQDLVAGSHTGRTQVGGVHGGGSPVIPDKNDCWGYVINHSKQNTCYEAFENYNLTNK